MPHWGYAVADFAKPGRAVPELDSLGADGWEAVVLLKRPRPEPAREDRCDGTT
jgi:hypothetical protein